jgi:hypothetical protein
LAYPNAERRNAARGPGASHLVDERRGQAGAAATKRVTTRNRATVDVQFCIGDAQLALAGERLRGGPEKSRSLEACVPEAIASQVLCVTLPYK